MERGSLFQHFLTVNNEDTILSLAYTLTGEVVNGTLVDVNVSVDAFYASSIFLVEVEGLNQRTCIGTVLQVSLTSLDDI